METLTKSRKHTDIIGKVRYCIKNRRYRLTTHAVSRQETRRITLPTIREVLARGVHNSEEDRYRSDLNRWSYAIHGCDVDGNALKVIVSFDDKNELMFIVTVMYVIREE